MQILGNYKECLTASQLKVGKVYAVSETGAEDYINASVYLGITEDSRYCFYILNYFNTVCKDSIVYFINDKQVELLPVISRKILGTSINIRNLLMYSSLQGRILKEFNIEFNVKPWYTKQLLVVKGLPKLAETKKKLPPYVTKSKIKENEFYFTNDCVYFYRGKINNKYSFYRFNWYDIEQGCKKNNTTFTLQEYNRFLELGTLFEYDVLPKIRELKDYKYMSSFKNSYKGILIRRLEQKCSML